MIKEAQEKCVKQFEAELRKLYKREPMTKDEKNLLEANRKLVERNIELERDVRVLVSYLKGRKYLKEDVKDIIKYYSQKKKETDE